MTLSCSGHGTVTRGRVGYVKQVGFEPGLEDSYGSCGSDKIRHNNNNNNNNNLIYKEPYGRKFRGDGGLADKFS